MPIIIASPFESGSYARVIAACGGSPLQAFCAIGSELTLRFFAQQAIAPPSEAYVQNLWQGIWESVHAEGLPEPLAPN